MNPKQPHYACIETYVEFKLRLCRNCDHYHFNELPCSCPFSTEDGRLTDNPCNCINFAPHDNLEFLQWKYERKL